MLPALSGAFALFYASILMIIEARKSVGVLEVEAEFINELLSLRGPR